MISFSVIGDKITGTIGDTPFSVDFIKKTYEKLGKLEEEYEGVTSVEEATAVLAKATELTAKTLLSVIESECEYIKVDPKTKEFHLYYNDVLSSIPMSKALVDRIMLSQDKGIDFLPLIRMWVRFLRNPNLNKEGKGKKFAKKFFNFINLTYIHPEQRDKLIEEGFSKEQAEERATMYQMKITKEGLLNGYKVSAEHTVKYEADEDGKPIQKPRYLKTFDVNTGKITGDGLPEQVEDRVFVPAMMGMGGDAFSCEGEKGFEDLGHFIKVGCTHALSSWDQVDTRDDVACVKGLHFGGLYYIAGISGHIHNIFVDPMHIGAVPDDSSGAVRCKQYFVHSSMSGVNGSIYHSSSYAAATDAEWKEMLEEAVKVRVEKAKKEKEASEELKALS